MSRNENRLLAPVYGVNTNPRLEFMDGQFLFSSTNLEGGKVERLISSAAAREAFTGIPIDSGWLRPEIVRWGNGKLGEWCVAFLPPGLHELELTQEGAESANVIRITTPLPGLVFFGLSNQYYIWAVKTDTLKPSHEIYRCPLPNVEETGLICWGPFKPPRISSTAIFEAFELFIKSTFNNHRANGKSKRCRDDVRVVLREQAASPRPCSYPVQDLMRQEQDGITLDSIIRRYFESGCMVHE